MPMAAGHVVVEGGAGDAGGIPFRVLAPFEQARFTREAWGQLLRLRAAGVVGAAELEQLIERALLQIDGRVGVDELRALLGGSVEPAGDVTIH
jgi:hypothetical protein